MSREVYESPLIPAIQSANSELQILDDSFDAPPPPPTGVRPNFLTSRITFQQNSVSTLTPPSHNLYTFLSLKISTPISTTTAPQPPHISPQPSIWQSDHLASPYELIAPHSL
ncbi:hypothetical protein FQN54_001562 [Arachnomyces sp. PD_36]|nr:hypothetical protein FQN54_001562 [Arachnomyces sp. PD_36]